MNLIPIDSSSVNSEQVLAKMDTSMSQQSDSNSSSNNGICIDLISKLYPNVNQRETPLPKRWSTQHKFHTLSLSHSDLRVTYKGPGKSHKDAASVRTDQTIPASCGIYYFEIKIISKGRDGYMGIGLSKSEVQLNRLPGWDKNSYGYHGDDGHSFCCSGTGQTYGPTFTTGDVIGCCWNLIENICFYTKNGFNLGVAFRDLPNDLHPTIGLQTPSESVEANFGQYPFEYDIHSYLKEWQLKTRNSIERFPLKKDMENNLPIVLRKLVSTYLVHNGYSETAEAFAKSVDYVFEEELASIRNRQKIQQHVINGEIGEAIQSTYRLFPGILEKNTNLLFTLKIRQFIEMINGCDTEVIVKNNSNNKSQFNNSHQRKQPSRHSSPSNHNLPNSTNSRSTSPAANHHSHHTNNGNNGTVAVGLNGEANSFAETVCLSNDNLNGLSMDMDTTANDFNSNKEHRKSGENGNGLCRALESDILMDMDYGGECPVSNDRSIMGFNDKNLQKILKFGREIFQLSLDLDINESSMSRKMLKDAFSLLAYHDPVNSPVGYQLDVSQREPVSAMLNSAILEANNMPRIPPLEVVYGQTAECLKLMAKSGIPWCSFVNLNEYMQ